MEQPSKIKYKYAPFALTFVFAVLVLIIVGLLRAYFRSPLRRISEGLTVPPGWRVQPGLYRILDPKKCALAGNCFGNNPDSPYGRAIFANPDAGGGDGALDDPAVLLGAFSLGMDQAVVLFGLRPPACDYLGFTLYLFDRALLPGESDAPGSKTPGRKVLFASLGDTVNNKTITVRPKKPFALVIARNPAIFDKVQGVLNNPLFTRTGKRPVYALPVPATVLPTDRLMVVSRTAFFASDAEREEFVQRPEIRAVRLTVPLTAKEARQKYVVTRQTIVQRLSRPNEGLESTRDTGVAELLEGLKKRGFSWTETSVQPFLAQIGYDSGFDCIDQQVSCLGDNRDASYIVSGTMTLGPDDMVLVVGVNHVASNRSEICTLSVYNDANQTALGSITHKDMQGSVLYKAVCSHGMANPLENMGVLQIPLDASAVTVRVAERAYLEIGNTIGPRPTTLTMPRVFIVRPPGARTAAGIMQSVGNVLQQLFRPSGPSGPSGPPGPSADSDAVAQEV